MDSLRSSVEVWSTREESSASHMVHRGFWGRIFYFLVGDSFFFGCTWDLQGKNLLPPYWWYFGEESSAPSLGIFFGVLEPIGEESSASSIGMMLDLLKLLWKSLLLPFMRIILDTFGKNLLLPSLGILCLRCLKRWGRVFYFLTEDDLWHAWFTEGWFLRCLNHWEWFLMGLIH